jgi:hypothetical protein
MNIELPASIQKLLWDADLRSFDMQTHKRLLVERVLNYGTLADWRWLVARYGAQNIRTALQARSVFPRSAIRDEARQLASLIIR